MEKCGPKFEVSNLGEQKNPQRVQKWVTFQCLKKNILKVLSKLFLNFLRNKSALHVKGNF